jgi:hypothetical protein
VFVALVGVEHHSGHRRHPALDGDGHPQRGCGQGGVVVLADGEPDDPA